MEELPDGEAASGWSHAVARIFIVELVFEYPIGKASGSRQASSDAVGAGRRAAPFGIFCHFGH